MTREEILNKYVKLIDKGYCSCCNELNCIDNFPHKKIAIVILEVLSQNKSLKLKNMRLNREKKQLELLVESLYLKTTLNQEQEELLNKILFGKEEK